MLRAGSGHCRIKASPNHGCVTSVLLWFSFSWEGAHVLSVHHPWGEVCSEIAAELGDPTWCLTAREPFWGKCALRGVGARQIQNAPVLWPEPGWNLSLLCRHLAACSRVSLSCSSAVSLDPEL